LCLARQQSRSGIWTRNFESTFVRSHNHLIQAQVRSKWWGLTKEEKKARVKDPEKEAAFQVRAAARLREVTDRKAAEIAQYPTSFTVPVVSITTGESTKTVDLDPEIFGVEVRNDLMTRVVVWRNACRRKGFAKGKNRSEMAGTSQKVGRQKGAGRARIGQRRSPVRRGGGKAFPPVQRDYTYTLPKKVRRAGFRSALASKFARNQLFIAEDLKLDTWKTKVGQQVINDRKWTNALFVDYYGIVNHKWVKPDVNFTLAVRNIPNVKTTTQLKANVYDILKYRYLILNQNTLEYLKMRVDGTLPTQNKKAIKRRKKRAAKAHIYKNKAKQLLENEARKAAQAAANNEQTAKAATE